MLDAMTCWAEQSEIINSRITNALFDRTLMVNVKQAARLDRATRESFMRIKLAVITMQLSSLGSQDHKTIS